MKSEYYYREACSKAIATQLARRANDFVSPDMIACRRKLDEVQVDFRQLVQDAARKMMDGSYT